MQYNDACGRCCRADDASKAALESREQIEKLLQQVSDLEAEIGLLRRRHNTLETDREKDKKLIAQLQDSLNRARIVSRRCVITATTMMIIITTFVLKMIMVTMVMMLLMMMQ